ncbi:hypothetical protein DSO57_1027031 [Entomophthora muscae]|uniref:Uncharacterized protein n=1 Tax=Entomophthora muscae TaxID=34485 RepID=A0ACC2TDH7_9FUNG|nr:hypothetical protein DSO57_1027031 [Entomophthora muscae]
MAVCEKVLDALRELQLCLSADSASADTPISDAQRLVALLDALDRDACYKGFYPFHKINCKSWTNGHNQKRN